MNPWSHSGDEIADIFETDLDQGLSADEAARRLAVAAGRRRLDGRRCTEDVAGSYAHDRLLVTTVRQPG